MELKIYGRRDKVVGAWRMHPAPRIINFNPDMGLALQAIPADMKDVPEKAHAILLTQKALLEDYIIDSEDAVHWAFTSELGKEEA